MNAKPNIPDYQNDANLRLCASLRASGYKIEYTSRGYRVDYNGKFIGAAGTLNIPHGRYREANLRDNLQSALSVAMRHAGQAARTEVQS